MSLQTREQHIRREKATSNICTAQALLANIAAMYAVYHGAEGIRAIAGRVHGLSRLLDGALRSLGYDQQNDVYFDTLRVKAAPELVAGVRGKAVAARLNFRYVGESAISIALDETTTAQDLEAIVNVFAAAAGKTVTSEMLDASTLGELAGDLPASLRRTSPYLTHPVFNTHHSETEMMRYLRSLERKDVGLDTSMIPLGSCTMKLNAASEMYPVSWEEFSRMHPF